MNTHTTKPVRFGDQIEIEINALAFGGDSVGRYQEFAVFVPGGLPGERVLVKITQVKDHYATGEILSVLRHSPDRVAPVCSIFEECGGCQWQHFSYPRQLQTKRQFVQDALERIGRLTNLTVQPCLPSPSPYAYRNKAMPVISMRDGHFISGIYEPRSHHLVPYHTCPIQGDAINDLIQKVLSKINRSGLTPYQEKKHTGFLRHLTLRQGFKTGEILLAFVTRTEIPEERLQKPTAIAEELNQILPRLAQELMEENPNLVGVLQNINPSRTNIVFGPQTKVLAGRDHYFEIIDDLKLKVSLRSFLQVNTPQADMLHTIVREALGDPVHKKKWGTVLDLYSGIGTLALAVSPKADYVVGVEEIAPAVEDARLNAETNHRTNIDFLEGDVAQILLGLKEKGLTQIDAAILDPPRKGVSPEILARIAALHPERLVYVSCDPSTLARDLALLTKQGFAVDWIQPLDMFPQTYHVETVVKLTRETPLPPEIVSQANQAQLEPFRLPKQTNEALLNISANYSTLKETTRTLGTVLKRQIQSLFTLFLSLAAAVLNWPKLFFKRPSADRAAKEALPGVPLASEPHLDSTFSPVETTVVENEQETPASVAAIVTGAPSVEAEQPLVAPAPPAFPKIRRTWKWPRVSFPRPRFELFLTWVLAPKKVRWVLAAAFLVSGVLIAKATLAPLMKKSSPLSPSVSQMIPDVIAVMPARSFLRYEMVPFEVKLNPKETTRFAEMRASVEVYCDGKPVSMVDGRSKLNLKKDAGGGRLIGNWPIPYNPKPGTYIAEVTVSSSDWQVPKSFESAFTIPPLKPQGLYPGYAALTMEGGKQLINGALPALDGGDSMRASNALDWAQFMGANIYCYLMGQTSVWDHLNAKDFPFNRGDVEVGHKYAKAAHAKGIKFAGYMTTFKVVGDAWNQAPYEFSLGYDPDSDEVVQTRFISLNDSKRRQDVIDFLKEMNEDPLIDMVGLDYVRTGFAGYEMVDEFVRDLNVPGPADYWTMSKQERIHWLARTVELKENMEVVSLFEWWRAHKVALALKSILDEAKMNKPVFTFTLGWQMGHQHGQDPAMFVDAGVSFNHIMLYEGDRNTLESMKKQWPDYLSRGNGMYAMGEMVDFNLVQKSLDPPGPEELYNREVETFHNWFPVNANLGMFWHDLYRLVYGIRGPYSTMEWTIAGGKAFTTLQQAEGLSPVEVNIEAPREIPAGIAVPINVDIHNRSAKDLKNLVLHQLDTSKNYDVDLATIGPFDLPAGNRVRVKSLYTSIPKEDHPDRDNRYMTAVMVEKQDDPLRVFDFVYLKKLGSPILRHMESGGDPAKSPLDDDNR